VKGSAALIIFHTPQLVYGAIHRINKKLNLQNKKELVHLLETILKEEQESIELPDEWGNF